MVDIDGTLARSALGIHPGMRAEWERRLAQNIRPLKTAALAMPEVAALADIAIVSGRPAYVAAQTARWLRRHFDMQPVAMHLCPVGTDPARFKASIWESYHRKYNGHICAIDDVRWTGPKHFFRAPRQWAELVAHLRAVSHA